MSLEVYRCSQQRHDDEVPELMRGEGRREEGEERGEVPRMRLSERAVAGVRRAERLTRFMNHVCHCRSIVSIIDNLYICCCTPNMKE